MKLFGLMVGLDARAFVGMLFGILFVQLVRLILFFRKGKGEGEGEGKGEGKGTTIYRSMIKKTKDLALLEKVDAQASFEVIEKGDVGRFTRHDYLETKENGLL